MLISHKEMLIITLKYNMRTHTNNPIHHTPESIAAISLTNRKPRNSTNKDNTIIE